MNTVIHSNVISSGYLKQAIHPVGQSIQAHSFAHRQPQQANASFSGNSLTSIMLLALSLFLTSCQSGLGTLFKPSQPTIEQPSYPPLKPYPDPSSPQDTTGDDVNLPPGLAVPPRPVTPAAPPDYSRYEPVPGLYNLTNTQGAYYLGYITDQLTALYQGQYLVHSVETADSLVHQQGFAFVGIKTAKALVARSAMNFAKIDGFNRSIAGNPSSNAALLIRDKYGSATLFTDFFLPGNGSGEIYPMTVVAPKQ